MRPRYERSFDVHRKNGVLTCTAIHAWVLLSCNISDVETSDRAFLMRFLPSD